MLSAGAADPSANTRAVAIGVLGLVPDNPESLRLAEHALTDEKAEVRAAAATALGQMRARRSRFKLRRALHDKDISVVLAAAGALRTFGDPAAYKVYYGVLMGSRKTGSGFLAEQQKTLSDPKKLALLGFEQGLGQIPFAGMGYQAIKALTKDDTSPVRAAAAKALANDPAPSSAEALSLAAHDHRWIVRVAALNAIAHRGDPALLVKIAGALDDDKEKVRYTAAATIVHLSTIAAKKEPGGTLRKRRGRIAGAGESN